MSDHRMRELERAYRAGDASALKPLNAARRRQGLPMLRDKIVHCLKADFHHRLNQKGLITPRPGKRGAWSACGQAQLFGSYNRSKAHYTHIKEDVTCKTCLRCIASPNFTEGPVKSHLRGTALSDPQANEIRGNNAVCGGYFGEVTDALREVTCDRCIRLATGKPRTGWNKPNARGRRRMRRRNKIKDSLWSNAK